MAFAKARSATKATSRYARVREVSLPFFGFIPSAPTGPRIVCCSIPIDDVTTAQWYIGYDTDAPLSYNILVDFGQTSGDPDHFNADMGVPRNLWQQDRAGDEGRPLERDHRARQCL